MNYTTMTNFSKTVGTAFVGHVESGYERIVGVFGEPLKGDGYKTNVEWVIMFDDGQVATIYDWKIAGNVEWNREWHVGGHNTDVVERITHLLYPHLKEVV